jgi:hypothetical protein
MDVRSPSVPSPILHRQQCDDLVSTDEPAVAERHHADVGSPHNIFFAHVPIVANMCSRMAGVTSGYLQDARADQPAEANGLTPISWAGGRLRPLPCA